MAFLRASVFREYRVVVLLSLAYVLLGALRLNDLSLYTDSTRYVIWGTSFAHAKGFIDETQPEPERFVVNAPFFSVLLSPVLLFFPYSLLAGKIWTLLLGVLFILAFYSLLRRFFDKTIAIIGVVPIVFNPLLLLLSTEVLSETSFLWAVSWCFLLLERLESGDPSRKSDLITLVLITSLIVLLREVAVALVGAIVLYFLVRKQYRRAVLIILGFAVCLGVWLYRNLVLVGAPPAAQATNVNFIFEHFLTPPQSSLVQEFGLRLVSNASGYALHLAGLIFYPIPDVLIVEPTGLFLSYYRAMNVLKYVVPVFFLPFLCFGIWRDLRDRTTGLARIVFVVAYLLIILLYPVRDVRFLLPVIPILIFYVLVAIKWAFVRWLQKRVRIARNLALILVGLVVLPNLICIFELERTNLRYTTNSLEFYDHLRQAGLGKNLFAKPWTILGQAIKEHTPRGSVIAGSAKEVCLFIGDRKLLELNSAVPVTTFERYLRTSAADYVISTSSWDGFPSYEFQMGESRRFWFEPVCQIAGMRLFKVHPTYLSPKEVSLATKQMEPDTTSANGLLRIGRRELMGGRFDAAISPLKRAQLLAPDQVLIPYQLLLAYAMSGQLDEASEELQKLYRYGQATSYISLASKHLAVAYSQRRVESSGNPEDRSLTVIDNARFYWDLGYYDYAYTILRNHLAQDSTYFVGLLWGWDYALQRGDTSQARAYLRHLKVIDRANAIVHQFAFIDQTEDSLRSALTSQQRSAFHLSIARSFRSVDLTEEAIDEAQRALREDPHSVAAWLFQAQLFEDKEAPLAARLAFERVLGLDSTNTIARMKLSSK
ncbi:MAG: 2 protein [Bacteroidetes bacterium]|nr:2 protein [Bacteroidota bacterium]